MCLSHNLIFLFQKKVILNSTNGLIAKIHYKKELQNIDTNHSADINHKGFLNIYRTSTTKPYSFLTIHTTLPANNPLYFEKTF